MEVNLEEIFDSDISPHSIGVTLLKVEPYISGQKICLVCTATCNIQIYLTPVKTQLLQYNLTRDLKLFYHSVIIKA